MQFKPNEKLEREIISVLLNKPENSQIITLKPDWFNILDYKAILLAIMENPGADDYIEWVASAKENGYQGTYKQMAQIRDEFVTEHTLKGLVKTLKKEYLNNIFMNDLTMANENRTAKNFHQVVDDLSNIDKMDVDTNSGDLKEVGDEIKDSLFHSRPVGIQTKNYEKFNNIFGGGLFGGLLLTVGARPGVGKSAFAVNLAKQIMEADSNIRIDFFSLEMGQQEVMSRFLSCMTGVNSFVLRDPYNRIHSDKVKNYIASEVDNLVDSNLHIYDKAHDLDSITNTMKTNASGLKPNHYFAIVDYIGLIEVDSIKERYLELGKISRTFKNIANDYNIPILELTQLNRAIDNRDDKHPRLSDIRESGSIEQDSNVVGFLSNNPDSNDEVNIIDFNVAKNREGELSLTKYSFEGRKMRMVELDE